MGVINSRACSKLGAVIVLALPLSSFAQDSYQMGTQLEELIKQNKILEQRIDLLENKGMQVPSKEQSKINIEMHGYVKADFLYDFGAKSGDRMNYAAIPVGGDNRLSKGHARVHARESRFNLTAKKLTNNGDIKAVIEGDFYGSGTKSPAGSEVISNSVELRLRHAYVSGGTWLVGQTWSNYVDVKSFPENLDFANDTGQAFLRQGQIRYTQSLGDITISYSVENPESDFVDEAGMKRANSRDEFPDLTARFLYKQDWGHVSLQSVLRHLSVDDGVNSDSSTGYGLGLSGKIALTENDQIKFHFSSGDGIGRYIQEAANSAAAVNFSASENGLSLQTQKAYGGYLGYQHKWLPTLRSNVNAGFVEIDWNKSQLGGVAEVQNESLKSYHVNLIWKAMADLDVGVELSRAERNLLNGQSGEIERLQVSAKYKF